MAIIVNRGQTLELILTFYQGSSTGPVVDLTGGSTFIEDENFSSEAEPEITIVDPEEGKVRVFFGQEETRRLPTTRLAWFKLGVTIGQTSQVLPKIEMSVS